MGWCCCHSCSATFVSHIFLIVSLPVAEKALGKLMMFWWTDIGTYVLATAAGGSRSECAVVDLHPPLSAAAGLGTSAAQPRSVDTAVAHSARRRHETLRPFPRHLEQLSFGSRQSTGPSAPWLVYLQFAAVLTVWVHACIGLHFWLRTKRWYPAWLPILGTLAVLIPALALAGYISGGNQIVREAQDPGLPRDRPKQRRMKRRRRSPKSGTWRSSGSTIYAGLVLLPFAGRGVRGFVYRMHRPPQLDPCRWTHHGDIARRDGARDVARQWHPARFGMRRPGALHHLPHPRGQRTCDATGTGWARSRGAGAHRRDRGCASRLPDTTDGRIFR